MSINLHLPLNRPDALQPMITVVGVGGAGGNAVNNMIDAKLEGIRFVIANTDSQALQRARTEYIVQMGVKSTSGLGAGANPDIGRAAAEEAMDELADHIRGSHMVFIAAGMGGGTGTGSAPVVARLAREQGILTVGVVTKPFQFEGTQRMKIAEAGLKELQEYVDTLIVIPNQNLFRIANERTTFADAFKMADEVLHSGVRGITDLIVKPGLVNLDFADIRTVMREMGKAMMGTGEASGERRAIEAAEAAISNPLLDDVSLKGARAVLINITGGMDMTLFEVDEAANRIRDEVDPDANIIFGSTFNEAMNGLMRVSVVATGIDAAPNQITQPAQQRVVFNPPEKKPYSLNPAMRLARPQTAEPVRPAAPVQEYRPAPAPVREAAPRTDMFEFAQEERRPAPAQEAPRERAYAAPEPRFAEPSYAPAPTAERQDVFSPAAYRREPEHEPQEPGGLNFFQKMAGVGRALAPKQEPERIIQVVERPKVVASAPPEQAPAADDYDVPAFLRRQAN